MGPTFPIIIQNAYLWSSIVPGPYIKFSFKILQDYRLKNLTWIQALNICFSISKTNKLRGLGVFFNLGRTCYNFTVFRVLIFHLRRCHCDIIAKNDYTSKILMSLSEHVSKKITFHKPQVDKQRIFHCLLWCSLYKTVVLAKQLLWIQEREQYWYTHSKSTSGIF